VARLFGANDEDVFFLFFQKQKQVNPQLTFMVHGRLIMVHGRLIMVHGRLMHRGLGILGFVFRVLGFWSN
jgi:hypothetical protein